MPRRCENRYKKGKIIELLEAVYFPDNEDVLVEIREVNDFWSALPSVIMDKLASKVRSIEEQSSLSPYRKAINGRKKPKSQKLDTSDFFAYPQGNSNPCRLREREVS